MKKLLTKGNEELFYYENGNKIIGPNPKMTGNIDSLTGNVTGLRGNIDGCELTDEDRENGIDVRELVG
jgi:hypothetical protein